MLKYGGYAWISLVLMSIVTELHSQYFPVLEKYNNQQVWLRDCAKPDHWRDYKTECNYHANQHYPSFFAQWMNAVLYEVKWCGVDKCETLFTVKGMVISLIVMSMMQGGPKVIVKGWRKFTNE
jgi:hypothetical protein